MTDTPNKFFYGTQFYLTLLEEAPNVLLKTMGLEERHRDYLLNEPYNLESTKDENFTVGYSYEELKKEKHIETTDIILHSTELEKAEQFQNTLLAAYAIHDYKAPHYNYGKAYRHTSFITAGAVGVMLFTTDYPVAAMSYGIGMTGFNHALYSTRKYDQNLMRTRHHTTMNMVIPPHDLSEADDAEFRRELDERKEELRCERGILKPFVEKYITLNPSLATMEMEEILIAEKFLNNKLGFDDHADFLESIHDKTKENIARERFNITTLNY